MPPSSSESFVGLAGAPLPPVSPKMNSKTSNHDDEEHPSNNTNALLPESEPNSHTQFPTPPQSHDSRDNHVDEDDYSDALSGDSQQRRHPRGGRKPKQLKRPAQRLQSVSEFELPTSPSQAQPQEEEQDDFDPEDGEEAPISPLLAPPETENHEDDYDADALKKARGSRSKGTREKQPRRTARNRSTGISSISIERPRGGGRKPPIAVSVERPEEKSKVKSKSKGGKKERERGAEEERSSEGSEEDESEEGQREKTEEKRKPVQIRLDLNLELEIMLKAKIKGDITITFLWVEENTKKGMVIWQLLMFLQRIR